MRCQFMRRQNRRCCVRLVDGMRIASSRGDKARVGGTGRKANRAGERGRKSQSEQVKATDGETWGMSKVRILVVDDEEPVLRACARALREIPEAEVVQLKFPRRAVELLSSQSFDLVVSDVRMPDMDGVELLRIAHQYNPGLPVILITGYATAETAADISQLGAAACIMKPILPDKLLSTVRWVLERR